MTVCLSLFTSATECTSTWGDWRQQSWPVSGTRTECASAWGDWRKHCGTRTDLAATEGTSAWGDWRQQSWPVSGTRTNLAATECTSAWGDWRQQSWPVCETRTDLAGDFLALRIQLITVRQKYKILWFLNDMILVWYSRVYGVILQMHSPMQRVYDLIMCYEFNT
jgi:hypothetical protein